MTDSDGNGFDQYKRLYEERFDRLDQGQEDLKVAVADLHDKVNSQGTILSIGRWIAVTIVAAAVSWGVNRLSH